MRRRSYLIVMVAGTLSGCASTGARTSECRSALPPDDRLLAEVVDSVRLQAGVRDLWSPPNGLVLARVHYDSVGALDGVTVLTESMPEAARSALDRLLTGAAKPNADPNETVHVFVGDPSGPAVRRVPRFAACAPVLLHRNQIELAVQAEAAALRLTRLLRVVVLVQVDTGGSAGEVRIDRSSGDARADAAAHAIMSGASFTPAAIEGIPVAVWISLPVTFQARDPRSG
jgi:TonB family protein